MAAKLGNYNEPFVNGATLKRLYSAVVKDNIFQDLFTRDGEAVTEKYCEDTSVAQVTVLRILPGNGAARAIGADTNGGFFNDNPAFFNQTEAYNIDLLDVVDFMIDIPEVQQDMMSTDLVAQRAKILGGQVSRAVNAMTIAAQLARNFNDIASGKVEKNWIVMDATPATGAYLKYIVKASANLDNGNPDEGIDTYPIEERAIFLRADYKGELMAAGQLLVGGSNAAQYMVKDGGLSPDDKSDNVTGFSGRILDMPVYMAGEAVWNMAASYLGIAPDKIKGVKGLVVSGIGTGRGLAFNASIKQIDSPNGAGQRMQPLYRFGAECWDALSVVPIVENGFTNPATAGTQLTVVAPGSRLYTITYDKGTGTGTAPTAVTGKKYGEVITLSDGTGVTAPSGKTFKGWDENKDATAPKYAAGAQYVVKTNATLYAIFA